MFPNFDKLALGQSIDALKKESANSDSIYAKLDHWNVEKLIGRSVSSKNAATFSEMLPLWTGSKEVKPIGEARVKEFRTYLTKKLKFERFDEILKKMHDRDGLISEISLTSLHNLAYIELLASQCRLDPKKTISLLEVGSGGGFLVRDLNAYSTYKYAFVLVDAVAESLAYSNALLAESSGLDVEILVHGQKPKLNSAAGSCLIVPAWRARELPKAGFDIVVNIAGVQEMPDGTAKAYVQSFDEWLKVGGGLYFFNSRDYPMPREYEFPAQLEQQNKDFTPRSRTIDYPAETFVKQKQKVPTSASSKVEIDYYRDLKFRAKVDKLEADRFRKSVKAKANSDSKKPDKSVELADKIAALKTRLEQNTSKSKDQLKALKAQNQKIAAASEKKVAGLRKQIEDLKKKSSDSDKVDPKIVTALETKYSQFQKKSAQQIENLQNKHGLIQEKGAQQIETLRTAGENHKKRIAELTSTYKTQVEKIKVAHAKQVDALKTQSETLKKRLDEVNAAAPKRMADLRESNQKTIAALKEQNARNLEKQVVKTENLKAKLEGQVELFRTKFEEQVQKNKDVSKVFEEKQQKIKTRLQQHLKDSAATQKDLLERLLGKPKKK